MDSGYCFDYIWACWPCSTISLVNFTLWLIMSKLSLFPDLEFSTGNRRLGEISIPDHTKEALDSYFLKGYEPGGFLTSVLTNNLYGAVTSADLANRHAIYEIVKWLTTDPIVPVHSWGTKDHVSNWLSDTGGIRTKFVEKMEKEYIWETLKG